MKQMTPTAVERAMKLQDVMLRAMAKRITWFQAAEILGISWRQMQRWHTRFEQEGYEGLFDRRRKLTEKAGLPGLRFHDLRHHAITAPANQPYVSVQTAKSIAGHVSQRMIDRYAHIQLEAKRNALLDTLSGRGNGTNSDTKGGHDGPPSLQVTDSIGRRVGI